MKIWNYVVIFFGIAMFMTLGGIYVPAFSEFFENVGVNVTSYNYNNGNATGINQASVGEDNSFWTFFFSDAGLLSISAGFGIIIIGASLITREPRYITIGLIIQGLVFWFSLILSIYNQFRTYPIFGTIMGMVLLPLSMGFIIACYEFFQNTDN